MLPKISKYLCHISSNMNQDILSFVINPSSKESAVNLYYKVNQCFTIK